MTTLASPALARTSVTGLPGADSESPQTVRSGRVEFLRATGPELSDQRLRALTIEQILEYPFPERAVMLAPWMTTQSLSMIHAWRGVGKTHVALNIAVAVATGGKFLNWSAPLPRAVLYLDGEMPGADLQERARSIMAAKQEAVDLTLLKIVTPDAQAAPIPDLVTRAGQDAVAEVAGDAELIIVDNISTLCRATGPENEAESWRVPQQWALDMRRKGKSVLFIHHSGKTGAQRGSSKREDILDVVIHLQRPQNYSPEHGACFEVHFEKFRHGFGEEARPIRAELGLSEHGHADWQWEYAQKAATSEILRLYQEGLPQSEIVKRLGKNKSTISRTIARARSDGQLPPT